MNKLTCVMIVIVLTSAVANLGFGQADSDAVNAALARGDDFLKKKDFPRAMDEYRKADKLAHHTCADCYLHMFALDRQSGDLAGALDDAKRALKVAGDDKPTAARAHSLRANLLVQMAGKPTDKKLKEAEDETREALGLVPDQAIMHYNLGFILLREERDAEGVAELNAYVASPGANPKTASKARAYIASPIRAREPFVPDFSFVAVEGQPISNAGLKGKVVLLDFWGTWCPPCRASVPMLAQLRKKYTEKPVLIVGISSDENEAAWKHFIAANHMDWPEYIDLSGEVRELFEVHSYPTYFVVDRDGIIRFRQSGFGEESLAELEEAIDKALKRPPQAGAVKTTAAPMP